MTADTLSNMILGYAVIVGILLFYIGSLWVRYQRASRRFKKFDE